MPRSEWKETRAGQLALAAIDKILRNLADSDFPMLAGAAALKELAEYRSDMALDVYRVLEKELS